MEPYLEKAQRTGRLIVPSKLGNIPEEAYEMPLSELSLAGNSLSVSVSLPDHAHTAPLFLCVRSSACLCLSHSPCATACDVVQGTCSRRWTRG